MRTLNNIRENLKRHRYIKIIDDSSNFRVQYTGVYSRDSLKDGFFVLRFLVLHHYAYDSKLKGFTHKDAFVSTKEKTYSKYIQKYLTVGEVCNIMWKDEVYIAGIEEEEFISYFAELI